MGDTSTLKIWRVTDPEGRLPWHPNETEARDAAEKPGGTAKRLEIPINKVERIYWLNRHFTRMPT